MRIAFIKTLCELAERNDQIWLLTGDLGYSVLEQFANRFPDRYLNVGVAEANMIGIAAGLALSGRVPFVYSIVPFVTMRCFEQVRLDVCYQNLNVKLIGVGGGLCYGTAGASHHSLEDVAITRALPNMTVVCPGDPIETQAAIRASASRTGPVYVRLGRSREPVVHPSPPEFRIGTGITIYGGNDITIIATGNLLASAKSVADELNVRSIATRLISMHTVKPIDKDLILKAAQETRAVFTIEEHSVIGGLGSAVAEVLAENGTRKVLFRRLAIPDAYFQEVGSQEYLRHKAGLSVGQITEYISNIVRQRK